MQKKIAVISIDVEDWYHLDYFKDIKDRSYSMLDGLSKFIELSEKYNIPATYFCLSEFSKEIKSALRSLKSKNAEIALHGFNHDRPLTIAPNVFKKNLIRGKNVLENDLGLAIEGYRAPCFSLDRKLLDTIIDHEFRYDSSKIDFGNHPLYGNIDLSDFQQRSNLIYQKKEFFEFELPTFKAWKKRLPISGGGYLRILPWGLMKRLLNKYLQSNKYYFLYIHPYELSSQNPRRVEASTYLNNLRFRYNIKGTPQKLESLIKLLKSNDFHFETFSSLRKSLIES